MNISKGLWYKVARVYAVLAALTLSLSLFSPAPAGAATTAEINTALETGVAWAVGQQEADGSWNVSHATGSTGLALAILGHYAQRLGTTPLAAGYAYRDNMQDGLDFLFAQAYRNPGDERVWFGNASINSGDNYVAGPVIMGIVMSGTPDQVVDVPGSPVDGLTYRQVVEEIINYLEYTQCQTGNGIGAWYYNGVSTTGDLSITGWVTLGLGYARDRFGVVLPQDMLDLLDLGIDFMQWQIDPSDPRYGGGGYTSSSGATGYENWINIYKTGHLLYIMSLVGDNAAAPRVQRSLGFLERHWDAPNSGANGYPDMVNSYWDVGWRGGPGDPPAPLPSYIATTATMKGLVALGIQNLGVLNWFEDMSDIVIANQEADGSWLQGGYPTGYGAKLHTLWALLTILRAAPVDPVVLLDYLRGGGGCFVATAAFGSYRHPFVKVLRAFRDRYLLTSEAGRAFTRFYYRHGPAAAAWIGVRGWARALARLALLPAYAVAWLLLNPVVSGGVALMLVLVLAGALAGRRARRPLAALGVLALVFSLAAPAFALNVNQFSLAPGEEAFLNVRGSAPLGQGRTSAGLFFVFSDDPLEGVVGGVKERISKRQQVGVVSVAHGFTPDFQLGLTFPYLFSQDSTLLPGVAPEDSGSGDLRLEGKYRFYGGKDSAGFALAPFFVFSTGDEDALMSEDANAGGLVLVFDYNWCNHSVVTFNVGYQYQSARYYPNFKVKHGLLFGLGASKRLKDERTTLGLEVSGRADDDWFGSSEATPVILDATVTRRLSDNLSLTAGAGAGLTDGYGAPDYRLFLGLRGAF